VDQVAGVEESQEMGYDLDGEGEEMERAEHGAENKLPECPRDEER